MEEVKLIYGIPVTELVNSRLGVIDGDSLAYIVGYNHKDSDDVESVIAHIDDFMHSILQACQVRFYIGVLNPLKEESRNFRVAIAVSTPYKGARKERPEWYMKWVKIIEDRLIDTWHFKRSPVDMEADDVVTSILNLIKRTIPTCTAVCIQNDKDLKQNPGHHYNFKTNLPSVMTELESMYSLFYQVIMGDSTDSIPGLPGSGKKTAEAILSSEGVTIENMHVVVYHAFTAKLGVDRGTRLFYESYMLCKLRDDLELTDFLVIKYDLDAGATRDIMAREEESELDISDDVTGLFTID